MTRSSRFLSTLVNSSSTGSAVAEPPEAVSVESDFVVILAALLCALICVVGLIMVARCAWLRRGSTANGSRISGQTSANKGIKKKFIEALPKFTYDSAKEDSGCCEKGGKLSDDDCAICLAEYADGDEIRVLPQCGHRFHVGCIDMWLGSHSSCPSCREILVITRCRKCGEFPRISAGEFPSAAELKGRQTGASSSSNEFLP
ncbi:RING-H2 finger protein ATL80-like [Cynara cardunculus var. scolymus]|uniref:Zinc finger, RING/FYVE/PHD-type n=1 Tax=Cynara cardunculus var. scolymus TaxID=59895 RepID=A0A103XJW4_CYNCS|nr:RING-H2 finger protein ATL80-like [Cynara cardunculus var. scolymus]KVH92118.1 Zinc finger, RING/FYVE/PHD-type [Cynara cardunculus var. scolymus]